MDDLIQRERSMSTGLPRGIAIPHARTDAVDSLVCAVGLKPAGLDFKAMDGEHSNIFVMTLSPKGAATPHIQFMAEVSQILTPQRCDRLLQCTSSAEVLSVLTGGKASVSELVNRETAVAAPVQTGCASAFHLSDHLEPRLIAHRLDGTDKVEIISELLAKVCEHVDLGDATHVRQELLNRERLMSTGLERGLAVPHCRTDTVDRLTCAIGLKPEGVDFSTLDGKPAHVIVLTLAPLSKPAPYVQFITSLALELDSVGMERILAMADAEEVWEVLCASAG